MRIAVVGATGMVGQIILKVLAERSFPVTELIPVASQRSVGKSVQFGGRDWTIQSLEAAVAAAPDVALFSAGGETSL
ncbi:aspartate-semialdehyde dehydrogenase, partial [Schleiferiaceae bacterium]|nr:aspartate-semialdehyde dehydrogenase [Schleiferiaceae bacterium]